MKSKGPQDTDGDTVGVHCSPYHALAESKRRLEAAVIQTLT